MKLLAALALAGVWAAGVWAGTATAGSVPLIKHTSAGNAVAQSSLLTSKDLGKSWTAAKATGTGGLVLRCAGYEPSMNGIVETGSAESPTFSAATTGPFVSQLTSVYASAKEASTVWSRAVKPGLIACVEKTLEAVTAQGIKVKIASAGPLTITKVAPLTTAYRVVATLTSPKQKLKTYFDVMLVGSGSTLSEITVSSFVSAVPLKFEQALAKIVGDSITVPSA